MSDIKEYTKGSVNPRNLIDTFKYNLMFARDNPDYFYPSGIWVFTGPQGSGKTLSAVQTLKKMCADYPKAWVCTNLDIKGITNRVIPFTDYSQLSTLTNGVHGIIFFLDEVHILWNSLESKEIPISEMACFCQMRKDRRVILGMAQVYGRVAKPIREQLQYVIDCNNYFKCIQVNKIIDPTKEVEKDGLLSGEIIATRVWFHSPSLYKSYDTLFKIERLKRDNKSNFKRSVSQ